MPRVRLSDVRGFASPLISSAFSIENIRMCQMKEFAFQYAEGSPLGGPRVRLARRYGRKTNRFRIDHLLRFTHQASNRVLISFAYRQFLWTDEYTGFSNGSDGSNGYNIRLMNANKGRGQFFFDGLHAHSRNHRL